LEELEVVVKKSKKKSLAIETVCELTRDAERLEIVIKDGY